MCKKPDGVRSVRSRSPAGARSAFTSRSIRPQWASIRTDLPARQMSHLWARIIPTWALTLRRPKTLRAYPLAIQTRAGRNPGGEAFRARPDVASRRAGLPKALTAAQTAQDIRKDRCLFRRTLTR